MNILLIMNPGSCSGRGKRRWENWQHSLKEVGVAHCCMMTEYVGHAFEIACNANDYDTVVAVGGDGTINEVLDGIMQSDSNDIKMGVLYSGTSPDFCRFHGIPTNPDIALQALLSRNTKQVDVVRIVYHEVSGKEQTGHFGCSCNIGMGPAVARYANRWRRYLGDALGTGAAVFRSLLINRRVDFELNIDGKDISLPRTNNLSILKNPHIASGLKLDIDIQPDDGRLFIMGMHSKSRLGLCSLMPRFYTGSAAKSPGVLLQPAHSVTVNAQVKTEIEFDGDPRGYLPAHMTVLPRALNLIGCNYE
jgi:diacylglycerol kinase family enzyme